MPKTSLSPAHQFHSAIQAEVFCLPNVRQMMPRTSQTPIIISNRIYTEQPNIFIPPITAFNAPQAFHSACSFDSTSIQNTHSVFNEPHYDFSPLTDAVAAGFSNEFRFPG
jgi:hypothetical protein